jgi:tetratricopeptide (TPR) repeat protein
MKKHNIILIILLTFNPCACSQQIPKNDSIIKELELEATRASYAQDWEKVIRINSNLIRLNNKEGKFYYKRGLAYSLLENYEKAADNYELALHLRYDSVAVLVKLTNLYTYLIKDCKRALEYINIAINIAPNNSDLYLERSGIKLPCLNDEEGFLKDIHKAIELGNETAKSVLQEHKRLEERRKVLRERGIMD